MFEYLNAIRQSNRVRAAIDFSIAATAATQQNLRVRAAIDFGIAAAVATMPYVPVLTPLIVGIAVGVGANRALRFLAKASGNAEKTEGPNPASQPNPTSRDNVASFRPRNGS